VTLISKSSKADSETTASFLLDQYRKEVKAELDRWARIEEKANRAFSFSTSVTAVLVGLFTLGQSIMGEGVPVASLLPFLFVYSGGVLFFAFSAILALKAQSITTYKVPYLEHKQSKVRQYLEQPVEAMQRIVVQRCVETLSSLKERNRTKANAVFYAQYLVIAAVAFVVVSMFVVIGALLGWVAGG
jgi:hypothetical protein